MRGTGYPHVFTSKLGVNPSLSDWKDRLCLSGGLMWECEDIPRASAFIFLVFFMTTSWFIFAQLLDGHSGPCDLSAKMPSSSHILAILLGSLDFSICQICRSSSRAASLGASASATSTSGWYSRAWAFSLATSFRSHSLSTFGFSRDYVCDVIYSFDGDVMH